VASGEAQDVLQLHQVLRPALYRRIRMAMATNITINLPAFFVVADSVVAHNHS